MRTGYEFCGVSGQMLLSTGHGVNPVSVIMFSGF